MVDELEVEEELAEESEPEDPSEVKVVFSEGTVEFLGSMAKLFFFTGFIAGVAVGELLHQLFLWVFP